MELQLNQPQQVNKNQYNFVVKFAKGLLAHRVDKEGNYWVKPLCFLGQKQNLENALSQLN